MSDKKATVAPAAAPAVHSDTMWDGPQWVEHLGHEPVWVETKQQYWDELNRRGLQMKDMQESSTGPEREIVIPEEAEEAPIRDFTAEEADIIRLAETVLHRYGMVEAMSCDRCFRRNVEDGTRVQTSSAWVRVTCRCGLRAFTAPVGTDIGGSLASTTTTLADRMDGMAFSPDGDGMTLPTTLLTTEAAHVLLRYVRTLKANKLSVRWFCRGCWNGRPVDGSDIQKALTDQKIAMLCQCRIRFWEGAVDIH